MSAPPTFWSILTGMGIWKSVEPIWIIKSISISGPSSAGNNLDIFCLPFFLKNRVFKPRRGESPARYSYDPESLKILTQVPPAGTPSFFPPAQGNLRQTGLHDSGYDKDYIVFADSLKTYILDRRGQTRVKVKERFTKSPNNNFIFERSSKNKKPRLVTTDAQGNIIYIYFNGKVESINMAKRSPNHYFDLKDVDEDGIKDFIILDKSNLAVYNKNKLPTIS